MTGIDVGPVSVLFAGVAKSAWNFQRLSLFPPVSTFRNRPDVPAGGPAFPSRLAGTRPKYVPARKKHCWVAVRPATIWARS